MYADERKKWQEHRTEGKVVFATHLPDVGMNQCDLNNVQEGGKKKTILPDLSVLPLGANLWLTEYAKEEQHTHA
jgi:hypothetical protein